MLTFGAGPESGLFQVSSYEPTACIARLHFLPCPQRQFRDAALPWTQGVLRLPRTQFMTAAVPMCAICHTDVNSSNPPLKGFPSRFNESFNVKFDHVQHNTGVGRPANGCNSCHTRLGRSAAALSIPTGLSAHNQCYTCHTPSSTNNSGREMASCGVCHESRPYSRTTVTRGAYRYAFSHAKHGRAQRLDCADCHRLTRGYAAVSSGEFTCRRRTFPCDSRNDVPHLSQRQTILRRRPGIQGLPTMP